MTVEPFYSCLLLPEEWSPRAVESIYLSSEHVGLQCPGVREWSHNKSAFDHFKLLRTSIYFYKGTTRRRTWITHDFCRNLNRSMNEVAFLKVLNPVNKVSERNPECCLYTEDKTVSAAAAGGLLHTSYSICNCLRQLLPVFWQRHIKQPSWVNCESDPPVGSTAGQRFHVTPDTSDPAEPFASALSVFSVRMKAAFIRWTKLQVNPLNHLDSKEPVPLETTHRRMAAKDVFKRTAG